MLVPSSWRRLDPPSNEDECAQLIQECELRRADMQRRLRGRAKTARRRDVKKAVRAYCDAHSAKIACMAEALCALGVKVGAGTSWPLARVVREALTLKIEGECHGPIVLQPSEYGNLESRFVFSFRNPRERARQILAHDALKAASPLPDWLFLYNGGERAAFNWLKERLPRAKRVLVTDFPKCFPLLPWHAVEDGLPLTREATRSLLFRPWKAVEVVGLGPMKPVPSFGAVFFGYAVHPTDAIGIPNCAGEIGHGRGIPPGAVLSPLVAQIVLHEMLMEALRDFAGVEMGLFADNLIILLPDEKLVGPVRRRLCKLAAQYFDSSVAAEFRQRTRCINRQEGFRYLGRFIDTRGKRVRADALPEHCERLLYRILSDLEGVQGLEGLPRSYARMRGFAARHGCGNVAAAGVAHAALTIALVAARADGGEEWLETLVERDTWGRQDRIDAIRQGK